MSISELQSSSKCALNNELLNSYKIDIVRYGKQILRYFNGDGIGVEVREASDASCFSKRDASSALDVKALQRCIAEAPPASSDCCARAPGGAFEACILAAAPQQVATGLKTEPEEMQPTDMIHATRRTEDGEGMATIGRNMYEPTADSGEPIIDTPGRGATGEVVQFAIDLVT